MHIHIQEIVWAGQNVGKLVRSMLWIHHNSSVMQKALDWAVRVQFPTRVLELLSPSPKWFQGSPMYKTKQKTQSS
jgi:hypothetical protein